MGEFQCYQFKCIDRPLSESERREVDGLSSRGEVTSHSATFIYHYSDFRHKPERVLEKYFDAMIYFTNWGTRRLMFRLPAGVVDAQAAHEKRMKSLESQEDDLWRSVTFNLERKSSKSYEIATATLKDLQKLAA